MATSLGIQIELGEENPPQVVDILHPGMSRKVALCINEAVRQPIKALWQTLPSLIPVQNAWSASSGFHLRGLSSFINIPHRDTLVVTAVNERHCQCRAKMTLKDKDTQKIEPLWQKNVFNCEITILHSEP